LTEAERWPLIIFIVVFPLIVLATFYKLVIHHHGKLYAPSDFKDDKSFLRTLSPKEQEEKLDEEVKESLDSGNVCTEEIKEPIDAVTPIPNKEIINKTKDRIAYRKEIMLIEHEVIKDLSKELNVEAEKNIGLGGTEVKFDAFLQLPSGKFTFLEVKVFKNSHTPIMVIDRFLYQAVLAERFFNSNFKLILAIVYYFSEDELTSLEQKLRSKVNQCPVDIELRFIPSSKFIDA
jgi:hypothetical protein